MAALGQTQGVRECVSASGRYVLLRRFYILFVMRSPCIKRFAPHVSYMCACTALRACVCPLWLQGSEVRPVTMRQTVTAVTQCEVTSYDKTFISAGEEGKGKKRRRPRVDERSEAVILEDMKGWKEEWSKLIWGEELKNDGVRRYLRPDRKHDQQCISGSNTPS